VPKLEHHKRQAKLYVRWHRQRHYPVAAAIRQHLPRFQGMSDPDILEAEFKLADAQELVARRAGFESWQALATGAMSMQANSAASQSTVLASEPQLFVADMNAAIDFYTGRLGFDLAFSYGEPPFYAQVVRDAGRINLRLAAGRIFDAGFIEREGDILSATIALDRAKPLFIEYQNADVPFHQKLRTEAWGARTFIVRDPDGNLIAFAGS
jgi:catechol 2,3-dioxygenase-like lactoylglutathione lyase family enzyme